MVPGGEYLPRGSMFGVWTVQGLNRRTKTNEGTPVSEICVINDRVGEAMLAPSMADDRCMGRRFLTSIFFSKQYW